MRTHGTSEIASAWIVTQLQRLIGDHHGDRQVALALFNPAVGIDASPLAVLQQLQCVEPPPSRLWTLFKEHGGTSKEDNGGLAECDQHAALRATWHALCESGPSTAAR